MEKFFRTLTVPVLWALGASAVAESPTALDASRLAPEILSQTAARIIADEVPREYERKKDWGRTTEVTTGLRSSGNFFKFDIHRRKSDVNHGTWKHYRLKLVEPERYLHVSIENMRTLESARVALSLNVAAKVYGWARVKVYERGVHIISLEAEGNTNVRLTLDMDIGIKSVNSESIWPVYAADPVVTVAKIKFDDFQLRRISNVGGTFAHEIGILLREAVEDELAGPKFAEKINRSIQKRPERLRLTPQMLLDEPVANGAANAQ